MLGAGIQKQKNKKKVFKYLKYLKSFLESETSKELDAITYHHYFMHQSVSTLQKFVNPVYLAQLEEKMIYGWVNLEVRVEVVPNVSQILMHLDFCT